MIYISGVAVLVKFVCLGIFLTDNDGNITSELLEYPCETELSFFYSLFSCAYLFILIFFYTFFTYSIFCIYFLFGIICCCPY